MGRDVKSISPFHASASAYADAGWFPIPLPMLEKSPPPDGTPNDIDLDKYPQHLRKWLNNKRPANIGTIVPEGIIGIDVDGPKALSTLAEFEGKYGKLPETWMSYRGNQERFHMWFWIPPARKWPGKLADGIDVLYRHYRYAVLPPSIHPSKNPYRWALPNKAGQPEGIEGYFPGVDELNELPEDWITAFSDTSGYQHYERVRTDVNLWLREHGGGNCCTEMKRIGRHHKQAIIKAAEDGGCHDAMINAVWAITAEMMQGHIGGRKALGIIKRTFIDLITNSGRRGNQAAENEYKRAVIGAVEKLIPKQVRDGDPCTLEDHEEIDPEQFFAKSGLLARTLRNAVEKSGKLAVGPGRIIYRYNDGLWTPDGDAEINRRTERMLGERFRPSHAQNVLSVVSNREQLITDDNQDTQFINLPNGLLDWKERRLYPHSSAVISTVRVPIAWNPDAKCPNIDKFISEVFPPDAHNLAYQVLGYMLFNGNPLHKAIILYGSGRNGKGTYLRLARMLAGGNNISAISPQALDTSQFASAQIYGKLANLVGDVDPKLFKGTEQFKQLTGGDYMPAQHKYGQPFIFQAKALMVAAFNKLPTTTDTTEGFFSKWVVVPFNAQFLGNKADPNLLERLTRPEELQGLLVRAIEGLNQVMNQGALDIPESVKIACENFRKEADPIQNFVTDCVEVTLNRKTHVRKGDIYSRYVEWCMANGYRPQASMRFSESLKSVTHAIESKLDGYVVYRCIKLME
jgi:putative DNA primase/helicase